MDIFYTQVYASRAYRFAKTIIGIIKMIGKVFFPAAYKAWRNRLSTDARE
jgi:hypothetical protein